MASVIDFLVLSLKARNSVGFRILIDGWDLELGRPILVNDDVSISCFVDDDGSLTTEICARGLVGKTMACDSHGRKQQWAADSEESDEGWNSHRDSIIRYFIKMMQCPLYGEIPINGNLRSIRDVDDTAEMLVYEMTASNTGPHVS